MARNDCWLEKELAELDEAEQFIQQAMSNFAPICKSSDSKVTQSQKTDAVKPSANQVTNSGPKSDTDVDKLTNQLIAGLKTGPKQDSYDQFNLPPPPDLDDLNISKKDDTKSLELPPPPPPVINSNPPPVQEKKNSATTPKAAPPPVLPKPSRSTALQAKTGVGNVTIKLNKPTSKPPAASQPEPTLPPPPPSFDAPPPSKPPASATPQEIKKNSADELDALTDNLLSHMENPKEEDMFGYCKKCNKIVEGEKVGCNALDSVYHIRCFTCATCGIELHGEPFYAVEKKPFCETCYVASLDKCVVCNQTITDRILRATGKPYHPACFTCSVCGKSLDGIPFTLDDDSKVYCVEDYHQKYAPRCSVCHLAIMPEPGKEETVRIIALDRSFHVGCYRCEKCQVQLSSDQGCYPLDNRIFCKECNTHMVQQLTA